MPEIRPYILSETNWKSISETRFQVAILPWGATEAHNFHLPYATDTFQCDKIVSEAAGKAWENGVKVIVLPTVPFGVNTGQLDVALDLNLNPTTQYLILKDIAETIVRSGIPKLVIMNGHGGNNFKQMIRELGQHVPDLFISTFSWYEVAPWDTCFEDSGDHAGELETSIMLEYFPDLVLPLEMAGDGKAKRFKFTAMQEGWAWAERAWTSVTEDTGIGNPKKANAVKGRKFLDLIIPKMAAYFKELSEIPNSELYE